MKVLEVRAERRCQRQLDAGLYTFSASLPNFASSKALLQEGSPNNHVPDK